MRKLEQTPLINEAEQVQLKPDKKKRKDTKTAPLARAKAPKKVPDIKIRKIRSKPILQKATDDVIYAIKPEEANKEAVYKLPDSTDVAADALFQSPAIEAPVIIDESKTTPEEPAVAIEKEPEHSAVEVEDDKKLAQIREELIVPNPKGTSSIDTMDTSEVIAYLSTCTDLRELRDELTRRTDAYEATLRGMALLKTVFEKGNIPREEFENQLQDLHALSDKQMLAQNLIREKIGSIMGEQRVYEQADRERHHKKSVNVAPTQPFSIRKMLSGIVKSIGNTLKNRGPWYKKIK